MTKDEKQLGLIALLSLALGVLLYAVFRPANSVLLLPHTLIWQKSFVPALFYNLPSLIHSFALVLLSISVLGLNKRIIMFSVGLWLLIGTFFEAFQHPALSQLILNLGFTERSILGRYFHYGTFDPNDILFTIIGAGFAVVIASRRKSEQTSSSI